MRAKLGVQGGPFRHRDDTERGIRTTALFGDSGYAVTRAAASLGAWDLVAAGSSDVVLSQVKTRDWPGVVEMETLRSFAEPHCRKLVHPVARPSAFARRAGTRGRRSRMNSRGQRRNNPSLARRLGPIETREEFPDA